MRIVGLCGFVAGVVFCGTASGATIIVQYSASTTVDSELVIAEGSFSVDSSQIGTPIDLSDAGLTLVARTSTDSLIFTQTPDPTRQELAFQFTNTDLNALAGELIAIDPDPLERLVFRAPFPTFLAVGGARLREIDIRADETAEFNGTSARFDPRPLTFSFSFLPGVIPEPASALLLGVTCLALAARRPYHN